LLPIRSCALFLLGIDLPLLSTGAGWLLNDPLAPWSMPDRRRDGGFAGHLRDRLRRKSRASCPLNQIQPRPLIDYHGLACPIEITSFPPGIIYDSGPIDDSGIVYHYAIWTDPIMEAPDIDENE